MNINIYSKGRLNYYDAKGIYDGKGVTVKKGSIISEKLAEKVNPIVRRMRENRDIVSDENVTLVDVKFRSPSTAATFISGNISNGLRVWKVKEGMDLKTYLEEEENGRH